MRSGFKFQIAQLQRKSSTLEFTKVENERLKVLEESPSMDGSTGSEPKGSTANWFEQNSWLHNIQTLVLVILLVDQVIIETISNEPQLHKTPSKYYMFFSCLVAVNKTYVAPILFFVSGCAVPTYLDGKLFFERLGIRVQCTCWFFLLSIIA